MYSSKIKQACSSTQLGEHKVNHILTGNLTAQIHGPSLDPRPLFLQLKQMIHSLLYILTYALDCTLARTVKVAVCLHHLAYSFTGFRARFSAKTYCEKHFLTQKPIISCTVSDIYNVITCIQRVFLFTVIILFLFSQVCRRHTTRRSRWGPGEE